MPLVSSVLASMFMPVPGCKTLITSRPITSAALETTSKYSARPPVLPTFFMSSMPSMPAMPTTTVQKMIASPVLG